jgi:hypothetical protein
MQHCPCNAAQALKHADSRAGSLDSALDAFAVSE